MLHMWWLACQKMRNITKTWNLKRAPSYLVCGPYWRKYNDYYQKWTDETTPEYDILYIVRTSFSWRFRIWSQNSNILSVASDMAWFLCINGVNDQFNHSRCSNCYYCYYCGQDIVLYVQNVGQNSLHQPSRYCLW